MNAAEKIERTISEPLSWAEICKRYPDQQVCLVEVVRPQACRRLELRTARVVGSGKTRREAFEQAAPWWDHYEVIERMFTGQATEPVLRPAWILDDQARNAV